MTRAPPAFHSSGHQRSSSTAPLAVHRQHALFTSDTSADQLTDSDCLSLDDATDDDFMTVRADSANRYSSMTSLPTLPPYTRDSDSDGEFLEDDYELHKFLFPDSILNDSACFGNIASLRNDDRLWCHDCRSPEKGSLSSDRPTLRPIAPENVLSSAIMATDDAHRSQSQTSKPTVH